MNSQKPRRLSSSLYIFPAPLPHHLPLHHHPHSLSSRLRFPVFSLAFSFPLPFPARNASQSSSRRQTLSSTALVHGRCYLRASDSTGSPASSAHLWGTNSCRGEDGRTAECGRECVHVAGAVEVAQEKGHVECVSGRGGDSRVAGRGAGEAGRTVGLRWQDKAGGEVG